MYVRAHGVLCPIPPLKRTWSNGSRTVQNQNLLSCHCKGPPNGQTHDTSPNHRYLTLKCGRPRQHNRSVHDVGGGTDEAWMAQNNDRSPWMRDKRKGLKPQLLQCESSFRIRLLAQPVVISTLLASGWHAVAGNGIHDRSPEFQTSNPIIVVVHFRLILRWPAGKPAGTTCS